MGAGDGDQQGDGIHEKLMATIERVPTREELVAAYSTSSQRYRARLRGEDVPCLKPGLPPGHKKSAEHIAKIQQYARSPEVRKARRLAKMGVLNPNWKGSAISANAGRYRARSWHGHLHGTCADCGEPSIDLHHLDSNPINNGVSNILALCRRCHMNRDGRFLVSLKNLRPGR